MGRLLPEHNRAQFTTVTLGDILCWIWFECIFNFLFGMELRMGALKRIGIATTLALMASASEAFAGDSRRGDHRLRTACRGDSNPVRNNADRSWAAFRRAGVSRVTQLSRGPAARVHRGLGDHGSFWRTRYQIHPGSLCATSCNGSN